MCKRISALIMILMMLPLHSAAQTPLDSVFSAQDSVTDIRITMLKQDFEQMRENALDERSYPATVVINGETFENVGFRTKGNSTLVNTVKTGVTKLAFKLDFCEYLPQSYHGIEVLNLNNEYLDASFMREHIMYNAFEAMGVPTPQNTYARLYVNGEFFGLYHLVENIGDGFLARHYGSTLGELYKPDGKGANLEWLGWEAGLYKDFDPKNAAAQGNAALINMINVLNHSDNAAEIESVLNVDEVLCYLAVNVAFVNYDSYLARNPHNYYLYENNGRFDILPWDLNMSFGAKPMKHYTDIPRAQLYIDEPADGDFADKPLLTKLFSFPQYLEKYHEYLRCIARDMMSEEAFGAQTDALQALLAPHVMADKNLIYGYDAFRGQDSGIQFLKTFAPARAGSVLNQLDGLAPSKRAAAGLHTPPAAPEAKALPKAAAPSKSKIKKAFDKLAERTIADFNGIMTAFSGREVAADVVALEQFGNDKDIINGKFSLQQSALRYNLILLALLIVLTALVCAVVMRKDRRKGRTK